MMPQDSWFYMHCEGLNIALLPKLADVIIEIAKHNNMIIANRHSISKKQIIDIAKSEGVLIESET